jgi:serine-type D-Ala-D-Ala carboxypeptidase/endopeptidase (penicillin-binding protein 4)
MEMINDTMMKAPIRSTAPYASLQNSAEAVLNDARMAGTAFSICIRNAENGKVIFEKNGDQGITPASSLKVLTAAAALHTLGENHRFSTTVLADGEIGQGILEGNLYLRGHGDPTLRKKDLDNFAVALANRGVKKITGNLIGDDTWFDDVRLSPGIDQEDESYYYAARVSALNLAPNADFDTGSIKVDVKPARIGSPAKVIMEPGTGFMEVDNRSVTGSEESINTLLVEREFRTNKIVITGNVPLRSAGAKEWISVPDPTAYALHNFKLALSERQIQFSASSETKSGNVPGDAKLLFSKQSMPLKQLLIPFMKLSNNSHAEALAKEMGRTVFGDGSWESGLRVMRNFLSGMGLDAGKWRFEDASGMSHANKITAAELSKLLFLARFEPWFPSFLNAFPVAGAYERFVGGTLRRRFKTGAATGNVMAKTGTLTEVSSLSGYAKTKDGEWLAFAILTQDFTTSTIPVIDRLVEEMARSRNTFK